MQDSFRWKPLDGWGSRAALTPPHVLASLSSRLLLADKIMRKFGEGTFGQVLECWDRRRKDFVALKIIRNIQV